jgi:hypothetical protein
MYEQSSTLRMVRYNLAVSCYVLDVCVPLCSLRPYILDDHYQHLPALGLRLQTPSSREQRTLMIMPPRLSHTFHSPLIYMQSSFCGLLMSSSPFKTYISSDICALRFYRRNLEVCDIVGGLDTKLQAVRSLVRNPMRLFHFSIYLILPAT